MQVVPWITKATAAINDVGVLPDAKVIGTWDVPQQLGCLDVYQPLSELLTAICNVGHQFSEIKSKNSTDAGKLHQCIHKDFKEKMEVFQDHSLQRRLCCVIVFCGIAIYFALLNFNC